MYRKALMIVIMVSFCLSSFSVVSGAVFDIQTQNSSLLNTYGTVYTPGTDITEQLKSDFGAGLDITIPAGHFYISESIVVQGYSGTVKGAGMDETIIEAAQGFTPLPDPFFSDIPGDIKVAEMFSVLWSKGDVTFADMTLIITGDAPAQPHFNPFVGEKTTIDNGIVVAAVSPEIENSITVTFKNIRVAGENSTDSGSFNGKNLMFPLVITGWGGNAPINAIIKNCAIDNAGLYGIEYFDAFEGSAEIKGNQITNSVAGIWLGDGLGSAEVTVKDNILMNISFINPIRIVLPIQSYCIKNNILDGASMPDECSH